MLDSRGRSCILAEKGGQIKAFGVTIMILFLSVTSAFSEGAEGAIGIPITFVSDGSLIHGTFFHANVLNPSPTAILLQGFPGGGSDVFGLGQALSSAGINALTFNWQGTWKSEGTFMPDASLRDVTNAISFVKTSEVIEKFHVDTTKIVLIGTSYGGGFALLGSLHDPSITKVATIAGGDLSIVANMIEQSDDFRMSHRKMMDECFSDPAVARGLGGAESHKWLLENREEYDLVKRAKELSEKEILLIGGWQDQAIRIEDHLLPLFRALQENKAKKLKAMIFDCGHSFAGVRDQLADSIIGWLTTDRQQRQ